MDSKSRNCSYRYTDTFDIFLRFKKKRTKMTTTKERRLRRELEKLKEKNISFQLQNDLELINIFLFNGNILTIILGTHYPFYCPEIKIGCRSYKHVLSVTSQEYKIYHQIFPSSGCCLLCSSFACKENWNVFKSIQDIISDVETHLHKKHKIQMFFIWQMVQKKFGIPLSLDEYL